jgi:hypothetical protein
MMSNAPPWLPSVLIIAAWLSIPALLSLHPRFRNMYRASPAAPGQPTATLFQRRPMGPDVMYTNVAGLLHYKPMVGAWIGVVSWCFLLVACAVQMPLPIAVTATPTVSALGVWGYLRPRAAVRSCFVDHNRAITVIRRDVAISFDLTWYRYFRMYCMNYSGRARVRRTPSMLVLYRDSLLPDRATAGHQDRPPRKLAGEFHRSQRGRGGLDPGRLESSHLVGDSAQVSGEGCHQRRQRSVGL